MKFVTIWQEDKPSHALKNDQPSQTVPDQAMTIPQIIAKFTRTGMLPQSFLKQDEGGQEFDTDSEFSPLDINPDEVRKTVVKGVSTRSEARKDVEDTSPSSERGKAPEKPSEASKSKTLEAPEGSS